MNFNYKVDTIKESIHTLRIEESNEMVEEIDFPIRIDSLMPKTELNEKLFFITNSKISEDSTSFELLSFLSKSSCLYLNKIFPLKSDSKLLVAKEVAALKDLIHPNVISMKNYEDYSIVYDYHVKGSLYDTFIEGKNIFGEDLEKIPEFSEFEVAIIIYQLCYALKHIHSKGVIHRNITLENILIAGETLRNTEELKNYLCVSHLNLLKVKLANFRKSIKINENDNKIVTNSLYCSPEMLNRQYNEATDMWSLGVVMFALLFNKMPFSGKNLDDLFINIKVTNIDLTRDVFRKLSKQGKSFLNSLFDKSPKRRLTASNATEHVWFKSLKVKDALYLDYFSTKGQFFDSMITFYNTNLLEKLVLRKLAVNLSYSEEIQLIEDLFVRFDCEKRGEISSIELVKGINTFLKDDFINFKSATNLVQWLTGDSKAKLNFLDFLTLFFTCFDLINENQAIFTLQSLDTDKNGFLLVDKLVEQFVYKEKQKEYLTDVISNIYDSLRGSKDKLLLEDVYSNLREKIPVFKTEEEVMKCESNKLNSVECSESVASLSYTRKEQNEEKQKENDKRPTSMFFLENQPNLEYSEKSREAREKMVDELVDMNSDQGLFRGEDLNQEIEVDVKKKKRSKADKRQLTQQNENDYKVLEIVEVKDETFN